jgi:competence protein ComEC
MISIGLSSLLFFMRRRLRIARVVIITTALWGFAFITGLTPSVLRATIMFTFLQAGTLMNRPAAAMNSLLASAFLLTAARPAVLFEAGFQLSYLAVAFILLFYDPLYSSIRVRNKLLDWLWQMTAVSLVAQAGTLALSIRLFNMFPLLFLATNIIVIPVSFAIMGLAFLLLIFSSFGPVASFISLIIRMLSRITMDYTTTISSMDQGVIENIGFTSSEALLLTISTALILTCLLRVAKITLRPFISAFALFIGLGIIKNVSESRKEVVIEYNIRGRKLKALQHGRILIIPGGDGGPPAEVMKHAAERGLKIELLPPG